MPKALEVEWSKLQLEYMTGQATCPDLAKKYNVSLQAIAKRCTREGWVKEKDTVVQRVSSRTIDKVVDTKLQAILEHEKIAYRVASKLVTGVETSFDGQFGEPIDSAHLNGLAQALKTSVGVCRQALGAVDPQHIDITSGGHELGHAAALAMLQSCKALQAQGKLEDIEIDIEGLIKEHAQSKLEG